MKNMSLAQKVYRSFVLVSILTALSATTGMLIDNIIVGRFLGVNALGAMGVVGPISLIFSALGNLCAGGGTARAAHALGRGDGRSVSNIFSITMLFVLVAGGAITVLGMAFAPQIATLLGARGEMHQLTTEYLYGFFPGAIPTIMTTALMGFVKIDGSPRLPLTCIIVMTVSNILLDLAVVFVFDMGMFGMALATSTAYCMAVLTAMTHMRRKYCTLVLVRPSGLWKELGAMTRTGAPTALSRICDTIKVMTLNNLLVAAAGTAAVAALNVRTQTDHLVGALMMGTCQAIIPVAGVFYGEESSISLKNTLKEALRIGLILSVSAGALLLVFPSVLPRLLGMKVENALDMARTAVCLYAVGMPLQLINTAMTNIYQVTGSPNRATLICVLQKLVFTLCFALALLKPMGTNGVWLAFLLGEACTLLVIAAMVLWHRRGRIRGLGDVLLLPEHFGGHPQDRMTLCMGTTLEEVVAVAEDIYEFGRQRQLPPELMHKAVLCVEELAGNVVRHAQQPSAEAKIELLVYNKPDELIIRLRDNGTVFDPVTCSKNGEILQKRLGLQLVEGVSDRFEYRRSIGLNNLLVVLKKKKESPGG